MLSGLRQVIARQRAGSLVLSLRNRMRGSLSGEVNETKDAVRVRS